MILLLIDYLQKKIKKMKSKNSNENRLYLNGSVYEIYSEEKNFLQNNYSKKIKSKILKELYLEEYGQENISKTIME